MHLNRAKFHFIGIGGIGMCGLAELLHNIGAQVTGSDLAENTNTDRLRSLGVKIFKGHERANVGEADVVVYSSAVQESNPEVAEARARRIPLIQRAEALAEIMRLKRGVAVAGTHGKTTTTSMAAAVFLEGKLSPTIVVGGRLDLIKSTALLGDGEWLIAEADESDGSFSRLAPEISVITNIDNDHLDYYKSLENLQKAFYDFGLKIPFYGHLIACGDDNLVKNIFANFPKKIWFYGFSKGNDIRIEGEKGSYKLFKDEKLLGTYEVQVPGRHNALNSAAAISCGLSAGLDFDTCVRGIKRFEGVDRRFHFKGEVKGVKVYDDYGHHPTEVKATLQAFKEKFPNNRLVVIFQPHRFSRTQQCWFEFTTSFTLADQVKLLEVYPAGEPPIEGITSDRLIAEMKHNHVSIYNRHQDLKKLVIELEAGDILLTLGAGDVWKIGMQVLEEMKG